MLANLNAPHSKKIPPLTSLCKSNLFFHKKQFKLPVLFIKTTGVPTLVCIKMRAKTQQFGYCLSELFIQILCLISANRRCCDLFPYFLFTPRDNRRRGIYLKLKKFVPKTKINSAIIARKQMTWFGWHVKQDLIKLTHSDQCFENCAPDRVCDIDVFPLFIYFGLLGDAMLPDIPKSIIPVLI